MNDETTAIFSAISFILDESSLEALKDETQTLLNRDTSLEPHTAVLTAIGNLQRAGRIRSDLADRLNLAVDVAKISNNNAALVRTVDERSNVNSLRDFAVTFDATAISLAMSPSDEPSKAHAEAAAAIHATAQGLVD
jgi:hypothetical protein